MARYTHNYPQVRKRRIDYSKLFNIEVAAKARYNRDMNFRSFVESKRDMNLSLADLYTAYTNGGLQLSLAF